MLLALFAACSDKKFEDVNTNVNEVTEVNALYLLNGTIGKVFNSNGSHTDLYEIAHHYAGTSFKASGYYRFTTGIWGSTYSANINLNDAIARTKDSNSDSDKYIHALALIFKSYAFQKLTDTYGDVPYSKAGMLEDAIENETPVYDTQESIYKDIIANLKKAIDMIGNADKLNMGAADRIYNGDLQKWKTFANTLRLRMALRLRYIDPELSKTVAAEAMSMPLIDSADEECKFDNTGEIGYQFSHYADLKSVSRTNTSKLMVDFLKQTSDLRLKAYALPAQQGANKGEYLGLPSGYDGNLGRDNFSYCGAVTYQINLPMPNLLYSEVCFMKAEAYLFGIGVSADATAANNWYRKGIEASLNYWDRPDKVIVDGNEQTVKYYNQDDINAFMATSVATLSGTNEEKFEQIAMQKWVSLMTNACEAFAEMRRTGYPHIAKRVETGNPPLLIGDTDGVWPRRVPYPDSEMLYNPDNYDKAYEATNNNSMIHKVWWDVN